jgi:hypothetical protein
MTTKDEALRIALEALEEAATSLETLSRLAGKKTFIDEEGTRQETCLEDFTQVRGYANSRALLAREALKQAQEPIGINGLTEAETSATMSVMGLSKPKPIPTHLRSYYNDWRNA